MARNLDTFDVKDIIKNFNTAYREAADLGYGPTAAQAVALAVAKADAKARTKSG